ncbi:hypothetical protein B296_00004721 [Ensete ventricosum]|uniref:Uncharacterized protein n=1 Tax=Ensete ventricosum TaxID=4639 RepID=A0A427ABS0_ENSVE|nr:hypothetical protein B296_00004721 [Ensete ventricosum]
MSNQPAVEVGRRSEAREPFPLLGFHLEGPVGRGRRGSGRELPRQFAGRPGHESRPGAAWPQGGDRRLSCDCGHLRLMDGSLRQLVMVATLVLLLKCRLRCFVCHQRAFLWPKCWNAIQPLVSRDSDVGRLRCVA